MYISSLVTSQFSKWFPLVPGGARQSLWLPSSDFFFLSVAPGEGAVTGCRVMSEIGLEIGQEKRLGRTEEE